MLKMTETITIYGNSSVDGVEAAGFQAQINSANPQEMTLNNWQTNPALYKANRSVCRADQAAFEDYAYSVQDKMIQNAEQSETAEV